MIAKLRQYIKHWLYMRKYERFCKNNGYRCPDCIYHDFIFDGTVFRGNRCRYPKENQQEKQL